MNVTTVGDIRKAIETLDDDVPVYCQVAAQDKTAWHMECTMWNSSTNCFVVSLHHRELASVKKDT